jgi:hypothetical protein
MRVSPPGRRSTTREMPGGLEVVVPSKRNPFLLVFLAAWLVGWAFGEVFAAREVLTGRAKEGTLFLVAWLVMWTIGGGFAIYTWVWALVGKEIIRLTPGMLAVRRDVLGFGRTKEYDLSYVKRLRVAQQVSDPLGWGSSMRFWGIGGGTIAFDYGSKTFHFAASIDEAEGHQIVGELKSRHSFGGEAA